MIYIFSKVYYLAAAVSIFVCISCSDETIVPINEGSIKYFPVAAGNQWDFYVPPSDSIHSSLRILDAFMINTQQYYLLSFIDDTSQADTISIEGNIIYRHRQNLKKKWIDFNLQNDQTYKYDNTIVTVKTGLVVQTKSGNYSNCISFDFNEPFAVDDEISYFFSKDVGLVKIESGWVSLLLLNYQLNQ